MGSQEQQVIGAVVKEGGVAHVHQSVELSSILGEEEFFDKTGLRLSWPARVGVMRLLQEDVLLQDLRALFHVGELEFVGDSFAIAEVSAHVSEQKLQRIADAVARANEALPSILHESKVLS